MRCRFVVRGFVLGAFVALAASLAAQHDAIVPESKPVLPRVDFIRDVKPILAQRCFGCHGPDSEKRKAKLRLDVKEDAFRIREDGAPFVPGSPDLSAAFRRVISTDEIEKMPPPGTDPLKPREIETLKAWIESGAEWGEHWAFIAPKKPAVPVPANAAWVRTPIDAFIAMRHEKEGIAAPADAQKTEWLRHVSLDLTGLPPTPEEIDAFLAQKGPDAYAKEVDRLLASPRYGERQAADWMDIARYADTGGYQADMPRTAWKWREWVINAFNANMPFDRFTIEQLAGDLLPDATLDQKIATGFNRNHPTNSEAGEEEDEYRSAYVFDRIHATATTWLGLTLACAQCHDHKYDPIAQKDFYRFYGFFNNVKERDSDFFFGGGGMNPRPSIPAPNPDQAPYVADVRRRVKALEDRLKADDPLADAAEAEWRTRTLERVKKPIEWKVLDPGGMVAKQGTLLKRLDDGSILATGPTPVRDVYEVVFAPGKRKITALKLEVLPDTSFPAGASGRADDGRFILSNLEVRHLTVADSEDPPLVRFARAAADLNQEFDPEKATINDIMPGSFEESVAAGDGSGFGKFFGGGGWSIAGDDRKNPHSGVLVPTDVIDATDVSVLRVTMTFNSKQKFRSLIGRFRVSLTDDPRIREWLAPVVEKTWFALGPFPAESVEAAHAAEFAIEKDLAAVDLKKPYEQPTLPDPKAEKPVAPGGPASAPAKEKPTSAPASMPTSAPASQPTSQPIPKPEERKKPTKLVWTEHAEWTSTMQAAPMGLGSSTYFTRKLTSSAPRTVTITLDGAAGWKVWLNGESVFTDDPAPVREADPKEKKAEPFDFFAMQDVETPETKKRFRLGLRAGENVIVIKASHRGQAKPKAEEGPSPVPGKPGAGFGLGGATVSWSLAADGEDLLDFETLIAVLADADRKAQPASMPASAPASMPTSAPAESPEAYRKRVIRKFYRTKIDPIGRAVFGELTRLKEEKEKLERKVPQALVMEELPTSRPIYVFGRGQYKNRGERVTTDTPAFLWPMPAELPKNRLGLAKWIVSRENPLTARVVMNRLWYQIFGTGIVRTVEDFGVRSETPSHPELLDWLATEFIDSGWDMKRMIKTIVLSSTYRQSPAARPELADRDPENRWLARGARLRLSAEMVRDQALFASGLLVEKIGGPSVKPYQPPGLWMAVSGGGEWKKDKGPDQYRRALYTYWKRGVPYPSFVTFDAAKRETCTVVRPQTTTPLQALVLLNDPVYVEAARMMGVRMLKEGGKTDPKRIAFGVRLVCSRDATAAEVQILADLLAAERIRFKADPKAAKELLGVGDAKVDEKIDPAEAAAWAQTAATILNMDAAMRRG